LEYCSKNIKDDEIMEADPLVTITAKASEIDAYAASMKELMKNLDASNRDTLAKIEELQEVLKCRRQRLQLCVEQYGIRKPELIKFENAKTTLVSLEARLAELKSMCSTNKAASINAMVDKVAESVRLQVARALDVAYS